MPGGIVEKEARHSRLQSHARMPEVQEAYARRP